MCNTGIGLHTTDPQFKVDWRSNNRRIAWMNPDGTVEVTQDLTLEEAKQAIGDMVFDIALGVLSWQATLTPSGPRIYFDDSGTPTDMGGPPPTHKLQIYPFHDCKGMPGYPCEICGKILPKLEVK